MVRILIIYHTTVFIGLLSATNSQQTQLNEGVLHLKNTFR